MAALPGKRARCPSTADARGRARGRHSRAAREAIRPTPAITLAWEPARQIYDPGGTTNSTLNNQIVVLPDGTLLLFFSEFDDANNQTTVLLRVIRSPDKGASWSAPITIAQSLSRGTGSPETGTPIRDGSNLGSVAVDKRGALAIAGPASR